jgi:hypothetical protein
MVPRDGGGPLYRIGRLLDGVNAGGGLDVLKVGKQVESSLNRRRSLRRICEVNGALLSICLAFVSACSLPVRASGIVRPVEGNLVIEAGTGASRWLDGHIVEVEGRSRPGAIRVDRWTITEGRNGLPAWVGEIVQLDGRLGLLVTSSAVTYVLDEPSSEDLAAFVGRPMLIEGWIDVNEGIHVGFFRALFDESAEGMAVQ